MLFYHVVLEWYSRVPPPVLKAKFSDVSKLLLAILAQYNAKGNSALLKSVSIQLLYGRKFIRVILFSLIDFSLKIYI
jgi:hypothetical protein